MSSMERITAGILSYNRLEELNRTLKVVLSIEDLNVIVVDNGSSDGSIPLLENLREQYPDRLRLMFIEGNIGLAARNDMFREIRTPFLLSLDDDSRPRDRTDIEAMLALMDADPRIATVTASCIHPITGFVETAGIERFASGGSAEQGYDIVNIASGGALMRMEAIRQTEGFGKDFFWGREEPDLAFQLIRKGWRVVFFSKAVVWHEMSPKGRAVYKRLTYVTRNSLWLLWKYFPLVVALPMAILFGFRRLLPCVKDARRFPAVMRGLAEGVADMGRMRSRSSRFTLKESLQLRGWLLKLLYE